MYTTYFGLKEAPFSIAPDPRYLFMSERHREALAHLIYGIGEVGGFVQLTGEVGTGKTTLCRCLLEQVPPHVDVALILNPKLTSLELLATVCDELRVAYPDGTTSLKVLVDALYRYLLDAHSRGRRTVLIVDEAQDLSADVLEQIRLLTNLETTREKLLQIILIGQPELIALLDRDELRQLAQRVTARFHLKPFSETETTAYVRHRLAVAGQTTALFDGGALRQVHAASGGLPRLINVICDRALLGAYSEERARIDARMIRRAAAEVRGQAVRSRRTGQWGWLTAAGVISAAAVTAAWIAVGPGRALYSGPVAAIVKMVAPASSPAASGLSASGSNPSGGAGAAPTVSAPAAPRSSPVAAVAAPRWGVPAAPASGSSSAGAVTAPRISAPPASAAAAPVSTPPTGAGDSTAMPPRATTPSEAPSTRLADVLADPSLHADEGTAFAALARRWGFDTAGVKAGAGCERVRADGLRCLARTGTWTKLRRYNLPAVVELTSTPGSKRYAVVSALDERRTTLDLGGRTLTFATADVEPFWDGAFILLWRPPLQGLALIAPGARGKEVEWLRRRLGAVDGAAMPGRSPDFYDDALRDRVMKFQRSRSLAPDGFVGEETLMQLALAEADPGMPLLSKRR